MKFAKLIWKQQAARAFSALLLAGLAGCGSIPESHFYTITIAEPVPATETPEFAHVLGVERLEPGLIYFDDRIVYRKEGHEVRYWNYHKWIAPPHILLTEAIRSHLKASGLFRDVVSFPDMVQSRWKLSGRIVAFEERQTGSGGRSVVVLELRLMRPAEKKVLWAKTYRSETGVTGKSAAEVVRAFDTALQNILAELTDDIKEVLSRE